MSVVSAATVVTVPAVVAVLALINPGFPVEQVDLNDGAVWLTNSAELKLGRYNPSIHEFNSGLVAETADLDVLQDAGDVLLTSPGSVQIVDPATVTLGEAVVVPGGAQVSMAAGTTAVTDARTGKTWIRTMATLGSLQVDADTPDLELGEGGATVVTTSGRVLAVSATDGTVTPVEASDGGLHPGAVEDFTGGAVRLDQLTAVGQRPAALAGTTLYLPGRTVDLSQYGSDLILQQPGPERDSVLVASTTSLIDVPFGGGPRTEMPTTGSGLPAAPVRMGSCSHAAWASPAGNYMLACDGATPRIQDLTEVSTASRLVFRVNRSVVVLNDTADGRLWMPQESPDVQHPNWDDILRRNKEEQNPQDSDDTETTQNLLTDCSDKTGAPKAVDDSFGIRPGRTTPLPVIDNDVAAECAILVVSDFDQIPPAFGTVESVQGGRALQLTAAAGASGSVDFTYTISDGKGTNQPSTATVRLTARTPAENSAPTQLRRSAVEVEEGSRVTYPVLSDFSDPDGDDLMLLSASAEGLTVRYRQDGQVTVEAPAGQTGRVQVDLVVSDGSRSAQGVLAVDVRTGGTLSPVVEPIQVTGLVDQPIRVSPLNAVRTVSEDTPRLAEVDQVPGASVSSDPAAGTFTFTAGRPDTYYVSFVVVAGSRQTAGLARVDVVEPPAKEQAPVAVRDTALLAAGRDVTIDPLANDFDPAGRVLVVQSVEVSDESLSVAVLGHRLLQISSRTTLTSPVYFRYTVSNGSRQAVGQVVVLPVPTSSGQQAPVVQPVEVSVRAGGVITIPVLDSAWDPDGDAMTLLRDFAEPLPAGQGLLFVSGDTLRYQAPASPTTARAVFSVADSSGMVTSAQLTVHVHTSDPATKSPATPQDLTAYAFSDETIRIPVPLTGIDPDGDGVVLLGQDTPPSKGRIVTVGADYLEYQALGEVGTDEFTYAVEDWVGQRSVATVRVGIVERPADAAEVVARDDEVTVRPGRQVEVRVLANDSDTSGGELTLDEELDVPKGIDATVEGRRVVVHTPDKAATIQIGYTARNSRGGVDSAVLTVVVDPKAPILPPVARDVVVPAEDTIDRSSVEVDVMATAQNPSGPLSDLKVSVDPSVAQVAKVGAKNTVVVTLVDHPQTLPYRITNTDPEAEGLTSYAFITVPALGDFPPMLRPRIKTIQVLAGTEKVISLSEYVQVAPGKTPKITDPAKVRATKSDGSDLVKDSTTLVYKARADYAGDASISFEVTDGTTAEDPTGRRKTLSLPIVVLAAEDYPPTFTPSVIRVAPGETPQAVDLRAFTSAPVDTGSGREDYTYRIVSAVPAGFTATLEGSVLSVGAVAATPKGTTGSLSLSIGYGKGGASQGASVEFQVVASQRQLARVLDQRRNDGIGGRTTAVEVLADAFNPFPGTPLTLLGAAVETQGAGAAAVAGSTVQITPAQGFIGQIVVRYQVADATGDPARQVEGRIYLTVRGKPDTPTAPRIGEIRSRTVVLSWDAPAPNGEPVTDYRVTASPGGAVQVCKATSCTIEGLTNNVEYRFTVAAHNAVGWSGESAPSGPARPDAAPDAPPAPALAATDGAVTVSWTAPDSEGSPVDHYTVELTPGPLTQDVSGTSAEFTGLTNGTAYTARVRAHNKAPEPGPWSPVSSPATPAGAPGAPTGLRAVRELVGTGSRIKITWEAAADNGSAVTGYFVSVDGAAPQSVGTERSFVVAPALDGHSYRIAVRARNQVGPGPVVRTTATAFGLPVKMAAPSAEAPGGKGRVDVAWGDADLAGGELKTYQLQVNGKAQDVGGRTAWTTDAMAGDEYVFAVRACNTLDECGPWSNPSRTVTATTPPGPITDLDLQPQGVYDWAKGTSALHITWRAATRGGTDKVTYTYIYRVGAGPWSTAEQTDRTDVVVPDVEVSGGQRIRVRVIADNGVGTSVASIDVLFPNPGQSPTPTPTVAPTTPTPTPTAEETPEEPVEAGADPVAGGG